MMGRMASLENWAYLTQCRGIVVTRLWNVCTFYNNATIIKHCNTILKHSEKVITFGEMLVNYSLNDR